VPATKKKRSVKKRRITAEDLYAFKLISGSRLSPDGKHVVYSLHRVDRKTEKKFSNLWIAPTDKGKPYQFTHGDQADVAPRWSPDGKQIAFLSNRANPEKPPELYVIGFTGGEARKLTSLGGTIVGLRWSPDGKRLAIEFRKMDKEMAKLEKDPAKKKLGIVSYHIDKVHFKANGAGVLPKEQCHIWMVDAKTGKAKQLTGKGDESRYSEFGTCFSPDGKKIVFMSNRTDDPGLDPWLWEFYQIPVEGGKLKKIETFVGFRGAPSFSPDGRWIAFIGATEKGKWWKQTRLWVVPADGAKKAKCLTSKYDFNVSAWTIGDLVGHTEETEPTWSPDSAKIYFQVAHHGKTMLKVADLKGNVEDVIDEQGVVGAFGFSQDHSRLAFSYANLFNPGDIWVRDMESGTTKQITRVNDKLLKSFDLGKIEEVWFDDADKSMKLHGWILKPPGFSEKKKYPSILEIHGGPRVPYGFMFMHEFYYLAAQGYVVYFSNPRGGQGYGEAHSRAIWNDWGNKDYLDLMAWTDYVSRKPYIDGKKMGVTGGSYGGYMTNWIIGHNNRFTAAVTQRCVSNLISMWGSSDGNWIFQTERGDQSPWENFENYWKQSPMKYIGSAKTPTLVIHSENDFRTDMEQAEQVFVALKKLGVPTEFVRYPAESHELSRSGRTDRRIDRLNHILRWFDTYLRGKKKAKK